MNEEIKSAECNQECFCKKRFKDALVIAIGSFVGVYCALSLFAALHKPSYPMMNPNRAMYHQYGGFHHHHQFGMPHKAFPKHELPKPEEKKD